MTHLSPSPDEEEHFRAQAVMLANRVKKTARHVRKWARRTQVSCYRLYDRDIPEIPVVIDWYEGHLHLAEFARGGADDRDEWIVDEWAFAVAQALEVPVDKVFIKARRRQRGKTQYERHAESRHELLVSEGGLKFRVNLQDYLDTGLFLDHRVTRNLVRAEADGCAVLNLFAYTGSFSVYAADGGASSTTTIDLSKTYLAWAQDNMALNGFSTDAHRFIHADVLRGARTRPVKVQPTISSSWTRLLSQTANGPKGPSMFSETICRSFKMPYAC